MAAAPKPTAPPRFWLSIDAAYSGPSGCALWHTKGGQVDLSSTCFAFKTKAGIRSFLDRVSPLDGGRVGLVVIEYPFLGAGKSPDTAIKLGRAVGLLEAAAEVLEARVELRTAAKWRKHVGIKERGAEKAKARCRNLVQALAVHPEGRDRVDGRLDRVWLPNARGIGETKRDTDRAEAIGAGLGYALEQGWPLRTA